MIRHTWKELRVPDRKTCQLHHDLKPSLAMNHSRLQDPTVKIPFKKI